MTVKQVGRTTNSITINISGIKEGDRSTYVYVPTKEEWFTLHEARDNGYINDFFVADLTANNGDITVTINKRYFPYKVIYLYVYNLNTSVGDVEILIGTVLEFVYDYSFPKVPDTDIDITVSDMAEINIFGGSINAYLGNGEGRYYLPSDMGDSGSEIYAEYLTLPAQNIYDAAFSDDFLDGLNRSAVLSNSTFIINNVEQGADFEARFFNYIYTAINNYNQSITYP